MLGDDGDDFAGRLFRGDDPVGGLERDVDGLFDDDMLARVQGSDSEVGVNAAGGADRHRVDIAALQQALDIGRGFSDTVLGGQCRGLGLVQVGDRDKILPSLRALELGDIMADVSVS
jgi:hypothetical protein